MRVAQKRHRHGTLTPGVALGAAKMWSGSSPNVGAAGPVGRRPSVVSSTGLFSVSPPPEGSQRAATPLFLWSSHVLFERDGLTCHNEHIEVYR